VWVTVVDFISVISLMQAVSQDQSLYCSTVWATATDRQGCDTLAQGRLVYARRPLPTTDLRCLRLAQLKKSDQSAMSEAGFPNLRLLAPAICIMDNALHFPDDERSVCSLFLLPGSRRFQAPEAILSLLR
jgi:hypothetical protein